QERQRDPAADDPVRSQRSRRAHPPPPHERQSHYSGPRSSVKQNRSDSIPVFGTSGYLGRNRIPWRAASLEPTAILDGASANGAPRRNGTFSPTDEPYNRRGVGSSLSGGDPLRHVVGIESSSLPKHLIAQLSEFLAVQQPVDGYPTGIRGPSGHRPERTV